MKFKPYVATFIVSIISFFGCIFSIAYIKNFYWTTWWSGPTAFSLCTLVIFTLSIWVCSFLAICDSSNS